MYPRQPMRTVDYVMSVLFRKLPFFAVKPIHCLRNIWDIYSENVLVSLYCISANNICDNHFFLLIILKSLQSFQNLFLSIKGIPRPFSIYHFCSSSSMAQYIKYKIKIEKASLKKKHMVW